MMSGYVSGLPAFASRPRSLHYEVELRDGGWCVALNGCRTRPLAHRSAAMRLARTLQAQADGLNHGPEARRRSRSDDHQVMKPRDTPDDGKSSFLNSLKRVWIAQR